MKENTEISERIKVLIEFFKINRNSFAKSLGYERSQAVYDIINGKSKPSFEFFERLLNSEYSDKINLEWLISGKGEMIKEKCDIIDMDVKSCAGVSTSVDAKIFYDSKIKGAEIERLMKIIKEKDALLKAKDEIIKSKDEIINLLKDQLTKS